MLIKFGYLDYIRNFFLATSIFFTENSLNLQDLSGTTELACRVNSAACYCHSYQHTPSGVYQIQPKTHVWDKVADNNIQVVGRKPGEEAEAEVGDEEEDDGIEMTGLLEELLFPD